MVSGLIRGGWEVDIMWVLGLVQKECHNIGVKRQRMFRNFREWCNKYSDKPKVLLRSTDHI